jgi:hypothetical protein
MVRSSARLYYRHGCSNLTVAVLLALSDPNQLSALLQVFPYHTDTVLQSASVGR